MRSENGIRFTKKAIDAIKPGPERGRWYCETGDGTLRGFVLVAYPASKVFFARFRTAGGVRRLVRIGRYGTLTVEEARAKAREALAAAELGGDPAEDRRRRRATPTFKTWTETYLGRVELRKKSPREDQRFLALAAEKWGNLPVDGIDRSDVAALHTALGKSHPTGANRFLASVRACFSEALRDGIVKANPAIGIKHHAEAPPRARVLSDDELVAVLKAVALEEDEHARAALRLLVETGARLSEVLRAKWDDVDFDAGTWRIPSPKSGTPQVIPLNSQTLAFLRRLSHVEKCPFICAGRYADRPRADLKDAWQRVKDRAAKKAPTVADVHVHDLRRTFGLHVARKAGLHVASKLLRHADVRVTEKVYAPLGIEELRAAVENRGVAIAFPQSKRKKA